MVAGWALAQNPVFLPGMTVQQAAASHDVLVAAIVAVLAGALRLAGGDVRDRPGGNVSLVPKISAPEDLARKPN